VVIRTMSSTMAHPRQRSRRDRPPFPRRISRPPPPHWISPLPLPPLNAGGRDLVPSLLNLSTDSRGLGHSVGVDDEVWQVEQCGSGDTMAPRGRVRRRQRNGASGVVAGRGRMEPKKRESDNKPMDGGGPGNGRARSSSCSSGHTRKQTGSGQ
jgi:hypothetical protein